MGVPWRHAHTSPARFRSIASRRVRWDDADWEAWRPEQAAERLREIDVPWCVAAGWSIDLFIGRERREHEDLEIAIPGRSLPEFLDVLAGFEVYAVNVPGRTTFTPIMEAGEGLAETHQTWVRDPETGSWRLDLFRDPSDGDIWICRRDERIRLPYSEVIEWTDDGIPYGRPEIVLLFKAKHAHQDKDQTDFEAVLPHLGTAARGRLAEWLELVHPGHAWIRRLT